VQLAHLHTPRRLRTIRVSFDFALSVGPADTSRYASIRVVCMPLHFAPFVPSISIVMAKDKILQESGANSPSDEPPYRCCAIFKGVFSKRNTTPQIIPPAIPTLPAVAPAKQDKPVDVESTPAPAPANKKQKEAEVDTIPDVPRDDHPSQTSREEKVNATFRKVREELEKVIANPNTASPIQLSVLDSSEIGNLSQMARDIEMAISEFMKERDNQKETQKGKELAKSWVHKVSFAGQRILGTASSVASVDANSDLTKSRNSSPPRLAAWFLVPLDIF
jgi:hypothetical protein